MTGKTYVIGAGLAGLSAATALAERGAQVTVLESAGQAGGRCRSYFDATFDGVIDNGNHLVLSGNRAVNDYMARIGAKDGLTGPSRAEFAFVDLANNERWWLRPNEGALPLWVGRAGRRVPGTKAGDYAQYAPLLWADRNSALTIPLRTFRKLRSRSPRGGEFGLDVRLVFPESRKLRAAWASERQPWLVEVAGLRHRR
jgi:glycine/D-amino acid oxidase-like deaminating enzyme